MPKQIWVTPFKEGISLADILGEFGQLKYMRKLLRSAWELTSCMVLDHDRAKGSCPRVRLLLEYGHTSELMHIRRVRLLPRYGHTSVLVHIMSGSSNSENTIYIYIELLVNTCYAFMHGSLIVSIRHCYYPFLFSLL